MTLENISNIEGLFELINKCRGNIELVSQEGDRINLKSRLAQYLSIAGVFSDGYVRKLEIYIEDADDRELILAFAMSGKSSE